MAEYYLKSKNLPFISVSSAGLSFPGDAASENSVKVMAEKGIDISSHRSITVTPFLLQSADRVFCMTASHKDYLISLFPEFADKISGFGFDIPDPYGKGEEEYRKCRNEIFRAVDLFFPKTEIRKENGENLKAIAELEKECFSSPWSEKSLSESIENGAYLFSAFTENEFSGYAGVSVVCGEGYITNIAVKEKFRNKGVGNALLTELINAVKDGGGEFISLEVRESNEKAVRLYEKNGFEKVGVRKDFYSSPKENALIMTRRFK